MILLWNWKTDVFQNVSYIELFEKLDILFIDLCAVDYSLVNVFDIE